MPESNPGISDQLRAAIVAAKRLGVSYHRLGYHLCRPQLDPSLIGRFVAGERSLTLRSADSLARALGLGLASRREEEGRHGGLASSSSIQPDT